MGADNLQNFDKWKNYEAILKYYKIWVYPRISDEKTQAPEFENVSYFSLAYLDISATRIRELIKAGKSTHFQLGEEVWNYIQTNRLYVD